ncbi:MAG: Lrp/AsnC family transcriptional regulator [Alphaproteobacteria bacterium]|nr:Lrp/AsnC family transcriptional regulator [Alphaproteobacteria bacterium]NDC56697.1 Lrp/AsnC family transcriptional regulator [Alphaproteobacteria bacterium]NDG04176.1 Lrp/AsnC family transcriptional regulator [Alphaproteobacteria bacterium]
MKRVKLDWIDLKMLRALQKNGRITNVELAKAAGISAPPCLRRLRALESAHYIKGYFADVSGDKLGYGTEVFIKVSLKEQSEEATMSFARAMQALPMVRECYMLAGETDFLLKVVAADMTDYQNFITHHLGMLPQVAGVKSSMVLQRTKYEPGVPITDQSVNDARKK